MTNENYSFADDAILLEKLDIKNEKEMIEILSAIEHNQWKDWAKALMKDEELSADRIKRWEEFMVAYDKLSEKDKKPDRKYAKKVLDAFKKKVKQQEEK